MKRYCLTLDLKNDEQLIKQYEEYHKKVWPEIIASIKDSGIESMEIYRFGTRLFMIIEAKDSFSFENKAMMDKSNKKVVEWEEKMAVFQQALDGSALHEKWKLMNKIFDLRR
ncbi:MAG TPA: L-rhamnose mutarotase [Flavisolibacter sp.]|jgi:L-rhamnose mutarotase|nr:L-rhamnose mutarotase [Flavisolibacter sp.]